MLMQNFVHYWKIPLNPIKKELDSARKCWNPLDPKYKAFIDSESIPLRKRIDEIGKKTSDCQNTEYTEFSKFFPCTLAILETLAAEFDGEIWVIFFVKLPSGNIVHKHRDIEEYFAIRDRYHIVLESTGSDMFVWDEHSIFYPWDFFWLNNDVLHYSENNSDIDRVHLIFDFLPKHTKDESLYKKRLIYTKLKQLQILQGHFWSNICWNLNR